MGKVNALEGGRKQRYKHCLDLSIKSKNSQVFGFRNAKVTVELRQEKLFKVKSGKHCWV